jgi:hypothetical protein
MISSCVISLFLLSFVGFLHPSLNHTSHHSKLQSGWLCCLYPSTSSSRAPSHRPGCLIASFEPCELVLDEPVQQLNASANKNNQLCSSASLFFPPFSTPLPRSIPL